MPMFKKPLTMVAAAVLLSPVTRAMSVHEYTGPSLKRP